MAFLFDIKRYSINDGPGVRITVFFKGCSLSCRWCHNPESISFKSEKLYNINKCIGCGSCVIACPNNALTLTGSKGIVTDFSKCDMTGKCAEVCPSRAMEISGKSYSEVEVMNAILRETNIMDNSGGGVTFSGGEPLMHPVELKKLLVRCNEEGVHSAIDTAGYVKRSIVEDVIPLTNLFLYDLKMMNSDKHRYWTGADNYLILDNLRLISESGRTFHVRIPLIEGVNCDNENIQNTILFLKELKNSPYAIELLPYHNIAIKKYEKLGRLYGENDLVAPSEEKVEDIISKFKNSGFNILIN